MSSNYCHLRKIYSRDYINEFRWLDGLLIDAIHILAVISNIIITIHEIREYYRKYKGQRKYKA